MVKEKTDKCPSRAEGTDRQTDRLGHYCDGLPIALCHQGVSPALYRRVTPTTKRAQSKEQNTVLFYLFRAAQDEKWEEEGRHP